ncbi:MAG TPA: hypothetical protein PLR88_05565 [Bacteroidales bacterium]|nr:hypothetical protein [Bacteroidales bacterium]
MKFFTFILSFYILGLIAMPCADIKADNSSHKEKMTEHSTDSRHHDHHHCSPFCTCECCVTPVITDDTIIEFNSYNYFSKVFDAYSIAYIPNQLFLIWQPPKLS